MKGTIFNYVEQLFVNKPEIKKEDFKAFIIEKNYQKFFLLLAFAIIISAIMLLLAKFSGDDQKIVYANIVLLFFSIAWFFLLFLKKNGRKSDWLFLIPICVLTAYASYLLGNFSYRSEFFSTYATAMFIVAIIYTASWQKIMILFLSSMAYLYFFTKYMHGGPLSYSSVNILTAFNILFAAWFVSRVVYLSIRKEFEGKEHIKQALMALEMENQKNIQIVDELQDMKIKLEDTIAERTQALQKEKEKAELSDKAKSIFLNNMSHQLRTPLSNVIGTLEMLKAKNVTEREKDTLLNLSVESTRELKKIVDDMLETAIEDDMETAVDFTDEKVDIKKNTVIHSVEKIKKILIVEDNKINRFLLKKMLEEKTYTVLEAENGEKAIENYLKYDVDAILMDIQMPVMNGYTALSKIRAIDREKYVPIIAITGYASSEDKNDIIKSGFDAYLPKPYEKKQLLSLLEAFKK